MSLSAVASFVGAAMGLLGLFGGAIAYLAAMRGRTTIQVLETDNDALRKRVETVEKGEAECKVELLHTRTAIKVLTETVTNAQAVADLLSRVDMQHADIKSLTAKVDGHFTELLARLDTKVAK